MGPRAQDQAQACTHWKQAEGAERWAWLTAFAPTVQTREREEGKRVVELANIYPYKLLAYLWATMRTCGGFLRASNFKFSGKKNKRKPF